MLPVSTLKKLYLFSHADEATGEEAHQWRGSSFHLPRPLGQVRGDHIGFLNGPHGFRNPGGASHVRLTPGAPSTCWVKVQAGTQLIAEKRTTSQWGEDTTWLGPSVSSRLTGTKRRMQAIERQQGTEGGIHVLRHSGEKSEKRNEETLDDARIKNPCEEWRKGK